jgi:hypothetical protein
MSIYEITERQRKYGMEKRKLGIFFVRVLVTLVLLYTAIACLLLPSAFLFLPPIFVLLCVISFALLVLVTVAILQLWRRSKFSIAVWLGLITFTCLVIYPLTKVGYETLNYRDLVNPVLKDTQTVEISRVGYASQDSGVLALNYVFGVGFESVDISDKRYLRAGPAGYLSVRSPPKDKSRYLVIEQVVKPNVEHSASWPKRGDIKIVVVDRLNGREIGIWNGPGQGWPGPQAATFIQSVLRPGKKGGGSGLNYPLAVTEIFSRPASSVLYPGYQTTLISNCPNGYSLIRGGPSGYALLETPDWTFGKYGLVTGVLCNPDGIFVFSDVGGYTVQLDWLSPTGQIITQGAFGLNSPDLPKNSTYRTVVNVARVGNQLSIRYAYFEFSTPITSAVSAEAEYDVLMPIYLKASPPSVP